MFRSGGLGNSCCKKKYKHDFFKKKTFRVYSSLRNEVRSYQPVLQCVKATFEGATCKGTIQHTAGQQLKMSIIMIIVDFNMV